MLQKIVHLECSEIFCTFGRRKWEKIYPVNRDYDVVFRNINKQNRNAKHLF